MIRYILWALVGVGIMALGIHSYIAVDGTTAFITRDWRIPGWVSIVVGGLLLTAFAYYAFFRPPRR